MKHAIQGANCVWETAYIETTVFRSNDPKYYTTSDWLVQETNLKLPYREATVFGKRHTGNQLCTDPMIQNIILPQIGLSQKQIKNAIQGINCIWETTYMETTVFTDDHGRPQQKNKKTIGSRLPPAGSKFPLRSPSKNHVEYDPRSMTFVLCLPDLDQCILNALGCWVSIGATSKSMIQNILLLQIGLPHEMNFKHAIQGDHCVPIP